MVSAVFWEESLRNQFQGYFPLAPGQAAEHWKASTFVFDANVLLNLYRYSNNTRDDFVSVLEALQERLWLPYQAAFEFLKNRVPVIKGQIKAYEKALGDIEKLGIDFSGSRAHPFISESVQDVFNSAICAVKNELEDSLQRQLKLLSEDPVREKLADLFLDRVGAPFSDGELEDIFIEGEKRYAEKVPPGYKDGKKNPSASSVSEKLSNFGDLVLWKEIIKFAASGNKAVIFVTDDRKEDWWAEAHGRSLGPRPELIHEFIKCGGDKLTFATPERFLENADPKKLHPVNQASIAEVVAEKTSRESDMEIVRKVIEQKLSDVVFPGDSDNSSKYLSDSYPSIATSQLENVFEGSRFGAPIIRDRMRTERAKLFDLNSERARLISELGRLKEEIRDGRVRGCSEVELDAIMDKINSTRKEISKLDDLVFQSEDWLLRLQRLLGDDG